MNELQARREDDLSVDTYSGLPNDRKLLSFSLKENDKPDTTGRMKIEIFN